MPDSRHGALAAVTIPATTDIQISGNIQNENQTVSIISSMMRTEKTKQKNKTKKQNKKTKQKNNKYLRPDGSTKEPRQGA